MICMHLTVCSYPVLHLFIERFCALVAFYVQQTVHRQCKTVFFFYYYRKSNLNLAVLQNASFIYTQALNQRHLKNLSRGLLSIGEAALEF